MLNKESLILIVLVLQMRWFSPDKLHLKFTAAL